jgi:DNA-binding transcriptional regulator YbjK
MGGVALVRQTTTIRKQQIIEAARRLITDRGMEAVTIDAIAETVVLAKQPSTVISPANNRFFAN